MAGKRDFLILSEYVKTPRYARSWGVMQEYGFGETKLFRYQLLFSLGERVASYSNNSEAIALVFLGTEHLHS
jgi:hypothetical protein